MMFVEDEYTTSIDLRFRRASPRATADGSHPMRRSGKKNQYSRLRNHRDPCQKGSPVACLEGNLLRELKVESTRLANRTGSMDHARITSTSLGTRSWSESSTKWCSPPATVSTTGLHRLR